MSLLARHPRYGFRTADAPLAAAAATAGLVDGGEPDGGGGDGGEATLLHSLAGALVAAYAEAAGSPLAALALAALLQQGAREDARAGSIRCAVWSGLAKAGVAGRVVLPLQPPPQGGAAATGGALPLLACGLLAPIEDDHRVLDCMVATLASTSDAEPDAGAPPLLVEQLPLLDVATHHVASLVFGAPGAPPPCKLGFGACELVRKLAEHAGPHARAPLQRLLARHAALAADGPAPEQAAAAAAAAAAALARALEQMGLAAHAP